MSLFKKKSYHGFAISLSSIRSEQSCGIGEFLDLLLALDFCKKIGFDVIQLLPLCDTGQDASPYHLISSCALDPIYLSLKKLPFLSKELKGGFHQFAEDNVSLRVRLKEVKEKKLAWLYKYYEENFSTIKQSPAFLKFCQENQDWLESYTRYKSVLGKEKEFYACLQFLCFSQMEEVKKYADLHGLLLQGDIPLLVSRQSADVWAEPELFDTAMTAGAPPDQYNVEGQNWGFPIFNWEVMRKQNFSWWKRRLRIAEKLYHLYRIDHAVGLFRIWAIPLGKKVKEGHFIPQDPHLWGPQGKEILQMMLKASASIPIAEDLGTIPKFVPRILKELGICGTKVVFWERNWEGDLKFIPLQDYEKLSVTTVSTHDSETLKMWWEGNPTLAKEWAEGQHRPYNPEFSFDERFAYLKAAHSSASIFHINLLQEYLALFPQFVSSHPEEERINIPGTVSSKNWTYRVIPTLERLIHEKPLVQSVQKLV